MRTSKFYIGFCFFFKVPLDNFASLTLSHTSQIIENIFVLLSENRKNTEEREREEFTKVSVFTFLAIVLMILPF